MEEVGPMESAEFKKIRSARMPTQAEVEEHEDENHAVYRDWREVCVASKGHGKFTLHRRRKDEEKAMEEEKEGPLIFSDYFFMSDEEKSCPMLALKC